MPLVLRIKERKIKRDVLIRDMPMRLTPSSSGRGEAIMIAPTTGNVQLKYLVWTTFVRWFPPMAAYSGFTSSRRLSFTKRKMVRSPTTPPHPATIAKRIGFVCSARVKRIIAPIHTVNVETKSPPAMKAPMYPVSPRPKRNILNGS